MKIYIKYLCVFLSLGIAPVLLYSSKGTIVPHRDALEAAAEANAAAQEQMELEVIGSLETTLPGQNFTDQEIRSALGQARSIVAANQEEQPELERRIREDLAMTRPGENFTDQDVRGIIAIQRIVNEATAIIVNRVQQRRRQIRLEQTLRQRINQILPSQIFTDEEIRAALAQAERTISPDNLESGANALGRELGEMENTLRKQLANDYPDQLVNDEDFAGLLLRGIRIAYAVQLLAPQRGL